MWDLRVDRLLLRLPAMLCAVCCTHLCWFHLRRQRVRWCQLVDQHCMMLASMAVRAQWYHQATAVGQSTYTLHARLWWPCLQGQPRPHPRPSPTSPQSWHLLHLTVLALTKGQRAAAAAPTSLPPHLNLYHTLARLACIMATTEEGTLRSTAGTRVSLSSGILSVKDS
jgi:hypothetical protein